MLTGNLIKVLGIIASAVGIGASLLSGWVEDKKMDERIDVKVNEALAKREKGES